MTDFENNTWTCPVCGQENNTNFCTACGTPKPVSEETTDTPASVSQEPAETTAAETPAAEPVTEETKPAEEPAPRAASIPEPAPAPVQKVKKSHPILTALLAGLLGLCGGYGGAVLAMRNIGPV
ncbi:MAG: hypothetical protein J5941_01715, partial [Solobacterium sp.]|nr:hypothetical protein [Solobacterium sp.]